MVEMTLDEIKECSLGVLSYIDKICRDNMLTYYLCGGTLLGAIRHKGFIPWDDDIDIMMPRSDYERLFKVWPQGERYQALYYKNSPLLPYAYGKAIDTKTLKIEPIRVKGLQMGVDVDIFPIDVLPNEDDITVAYYKRIERMQKRLEFQVAFFEKRSTIPRTIVRNAQLLFLRFCNLLGLSTVRKVVKQFDELAQFYKDVNTGYCGITAISHYGIKEKNPITNYGETVNVLFEGRYYPAPNGYSDYLARLYGEDYMNLPPNNKRQSHHHYVAYWK